MLGSVLKRLLPQRLTFRRTRFADVYALYERGELARAERDSAAIGDAERPDIDFLRGLIAKKRSDPVAAALAMEAAAAARPGETAFHFALADVLFALHRFESALEHYEAALAGAKLDSASRVSALRDAGRAYIRLGQTARGCAYLERALEHAPGDPAIVNYLSTALYREARIPEAWRAIEPLVRAGLGGMRLRRALFLPAVYESQTEIDAVRARFSQELDEVLDAREPHIADPAAEVGVTGFNLAYHNRNNAPLLAKLCRAMRHLCPAAAQAAPPKRAPRGRRLRIGFVSSFFQLHSVARTTIGFIRDLPRERFEVHVFAIEPAQDAMGRAVESAADVYVKLARDLGAIRRAVADAALDVLVFADVGMDPITYALALWRLAPVQAVSWGHSDTSGVDTIDYYLSAEGVEIESADAHYTERLVRPRAFFLGGYERPRLAQPIGREALGLPADVRLYGCLQPVFKLHPDIDAVLVALLERDARAEIVLLESKAHAAELVRRRFARTLGPLASRIRFLPALPMDRYVATLAAMDVALDPLYFGGCNSSCEALALGVPLVTLPGAHLYGRFTLGLYRELGIEDCVAASVEDYVERAHRLANDRDYRTAVSRELAERSGALFDRKDITLAYADFLEEAFARA
ncbi:MAG TPA: hypothetical protein VHP37_12530 [Burkholderiales bacterium]|nr:hypothetical protein [Burkholderiales bacterium]